MRGSINSKLSSDTLDRDDGTYSKQRDNSLSSQETNENASKPPMSIDLATSKLSKPIKSETKSSPMTNEKIDVASNNKPPKS